MITDEQLLRYSRHILLDEIDIAGQESILNGRILVIGAGGLAHPALIYLISSGVEQLTIIDDDQIELSNLARQFWFNKHDIGRNKVSVLSQRLQNLNPAAQIHPIVAKADLTLLQQQVPWADVVLDCTDNYASRSLINQVCFQHRKVLVSASALIFSGQLAVFDFRQGQGPCYQCLFNGKVSDQDASCAKNGVYSPLLGIMGSAQANEALQILAGIHDQQGYLHCFDARHFQWQKFQLNANPSCSVCSKIALSTE